MEATVSVIDGIKQWWMITFGIRVFLDGIVESETMLSRSALAHIYEKAKAKTLGTTAPIGSAKRGPLVLHRARNETIRYKQQIHIFYPLKLPPGQDDSDSRFASLLGD